MGYDRKTAIQVNWILLGLAMLIPGLLKLFVMKPAAIVTMLSGLGFPSATAFAWILILSEIVFGALILGRYKLKYTTIPPIIILLVATFTAHWANWTMMIVHLALASSYWLLGMRGK